MATSCDACIAGDFSGAEALGLSDAPNVLYLGTSPIISAELWDNIVSWEIGKSRDSREIRVAEMFSYFRQLE